MLSPVQERAAEYMAKGAKPSLALKKARKDAGLDDLRPNSFKSMASQLGKHPGVLARVDALRGGALVIPPPRNTRLLELAEHMATLASLRDQAREAGQLQVARLCELDLGRLSGLWRDIDNPQRGPQAAVQVNVISNLPMEDQPR